LCSSEVTRKIKQLEVKGNVPQCPIAGEANGKVTNDLVVEKQLLLIAAALSLSDS